MALAGSLSGEGGAAAPGGDSVQPPEPEHRPSAAPEGLSGALDGLLEGLSPELIGRLLSLLGELRRGGGEKEQLLTALRPFLRPERREALDRAIGLARVSHVIHAALGLMRGEEDV